MKSTVKIAIIVMMFAGVILDFASWYNRYFAKFIIYFELVNALITAFVPINYGDVANIVVFF